MSTRSDRNRVYATSLVTGVGVSTHFAPTKRSSRAASMPSCSEPAIGWPPMKRAASSGRRRAISSTIGALTDPTSVTRPTPASSASTTTSAIAATGTATNATSTSRNAPARSGAGNITASRLTAAARRSASRSNPTTSCPSPARARPIDPPTRPVPTTATRITPPLLGKVVAQRPRALEIYVMQFVARRLAVEVHHHADRALHAVADAQLARAQERDSAQAERPSRSRRELGREIVGGSEQNADEIGVLDPVAFEHLHDELLRLAIDLVLGVLVAGRRAPQGQQSHGFSG